MCCRCPLLCPCGRLLPRSWYVGILGRWWRSLSCHRRKGPSTVSSVHENSVTGSRGCLRCFTLGVTVIIFSVWLNSQPSRLFPLQTFSTHFSELFCFLRTLTMSLCFSKAPGGFSSLFSLSADSHLQNSLTLFPHYLSVLSPKSQQYVV